jgi:ferredoxin--NADP+ reductase
MTDVTIEKPALEPTGALSVETVLSVKHWNEHLFSFRITRPAAFRFRSGEFIMIGLKGDNGKPLLRAYSIASPSWDEEIEFLSIKVPDGPLTSKLQKIEPGDQIYLGRKPTGTLVTDALLPGKRLFMLSTGTGLAPFLSLPRDPDIYDFYEQVVVVHSVRRVSDLAFREEMEGRWAQDPLVSEQAASQFHYVPTVTREAFPNNERQAIRRDSGRGDVRSRNRPDHDVRQHGHDQAVRNLFRRAGLHRRIKRGAGSVCNRAGICWLSIFGLA